jgi:hypothetical protein
MGRFYVAGLPTAQPSPRALVLAIVLGTTACYGAPPETAELGVDEEELLTAVRSMEGSNSFAPMNAAPYPTALPSAAPIDVFVSTTSHAWYAAIAPENEGSGVVVPEGTMIVRAVLGAGGATETITLMYKGAPGYNPDLGDFWFGVTDASGEPKVVDGVAQVGRLEACYSCHAERADDDFLFGVPAINRVLVTDHPGPRTPAAR